MPPSASKVLAFLLAASCAPGCSSRAGARDGGAGAGDAAARGLDASAASAGKDEEIEVARVVRKDGGSDWVGHIAGVYPIGDGEAFITYGLHLARVHRDEVTLRPESSRGLPVQTDPCSAPAVEEIRRERDGKIVLTLRDLGSPHFTGGCLDREPSDEAYAWIGERWVTTGAPAWARTRTRTVFAESSVGDKVVRLVGPRVSPQTDGYNPPDASEHLGVCFGSGHTALAGWDPPEGLLSLPEDLCVEGIGFGARADDALLFGRTRDGAMWLERRAPGAVPKRVRVPVRRECATRSSHSPLALVGLDRGQLVVGAACRPPAGAKRPEDWSEATFGFQFDMATGAVLPSDADATARGGAERAESRLAIGTDRALVERSGHVFLTSRTRPPLATPIAIPADATPPGRVLSLPRSARTGGCGPSTFHVFAEIPAGDGDASARERTRTALAALVKEHPEVGAGAEPFVELRIGETWFVGRHWASDLPAPGARAAARVSQTVAERAVPWARARGLGLTGLCLPAYPPGEGTTFRVSSRGELEWVDREKAVRVLVER